MAATAMKENTGSRALGAALLSLTGAASLLLGGCAMSTTVGAVTGSPAPVTGAVTPVSGRVMGGQQPVAGVALQMYATGSGSYGAASTPLFPPGSVTTTALGNFTIPAFTCPSGNPMVYLVGTGGTPIGGSANPNLALMAGLGPCQAAETGLQNGTVFIDMNELTTVATVWASGKFMTGITNIGAPASNSTGLANAFAAINKVVNIGTGTAPGMTLPTGATLPIAEINTLGNILQNCVNSAGGSASDTTDGLTNGTSCGKLFYLSTVNGAAPTNTITAAMNIAAHPSVNTAKLNDLQSSIPAFSPSYSVNAPPTDWTIAITYTGGGLSTPRTVANDASGNVWVSNRGNNSVTELNNTGAAVSPATGFTAGNITTPWGLAIDESGYIWVSNGNNSLTKLSSTGTTGTVYTGNGLSTPKGIGIDGSGNVWVADSGNSSVSEFSSSGAAVGIYNGGGISAPTSIAINPK